MDAPAARASEMDPLNTTSSTTIVYKIPKYVIQRGPGMQEIPALTQCRFNSATQRGTCLRGNKHFNISCLYHDQYF